MPKSKIFLPDVNVWLALASRRHVHAAVMGYFLAANATLQSSASVKGMMQSFLMEYLTLMFSTCMAVSRIC